MRIYQTAAELRLAVPQRNWWTLRRCDAALGAVVLNLLGHPLVELAPNTRGEPGQRDHAETVSIGATREQESRQGETRSA